MPRALDAAALRSLRRVGAVSPTDDEVIKWIEAFYDGLGIPEIARATGWPERTVELHLAAQGVAEPMPPEEKPVRPVIDRSDDARRAAGRLTEAEQRIARALVDAAPEIDSADAGTYPLPHPMRRQHVQSNQQRKQAAGARYWSGAVRRDLRQAGLMGGEGAGLGGRFGGYWT